MSLDNLARNPSVHLRLALLGLGATIESTVEQDLPFSSGYIGEAEAVSGLRFDPATWHAALVRWANANPGLPLNRLAQAGITQLECAVLLAAGLVGEDPRFGQLLGNGRRATIGGLIALLRHAEGDDAPHAVKQAINRLASLGMIEVANQDLPRADQELSVAIPLWDALAGDRQPPPGCRFDPPDTLTALTAYVADEATTHRMTRLVAIWREDPMLVPCLRGPGRNGRKTLAAAMARAIDRPVLWIDNTICDDAVRWRQAGLFAFLHDAVIVVAPLYGPGEVRELSPFSLGPVRMIVIGANSGGIRVSDRPLATLVLGPPTTTVRARHWRAALPGLAAAQIERLASAFQITSGSIHRAAQGAGIRAAQAGHDGIDTIDVRAALRDLQDSRLETVASRIEIGETPEYLALDELAEGEILGLATRCRNREALAAFAGPGPGSAGVRALFAGPSGAGKTLAARRLGHDLQRDVWRIDLSAAVNKYIGETEKALDRAFAAAEELDIILLLDEGDALMARRTDVGNSNDRYANLETNFLLQRIESYSGILIVTTNAGERIDQAFQRRMDVVVAFRAPDELRRYQILEHHLIGHGVTDELVQEVAVRCAVSGGQLRNIALHARLLALDDGRAIDDDHLRRAVFREYRKLEAHCPLKPMLSAIG